MRTSKIKHISVQKITKNNSEFQVLGISSECWVLFSILHKQCVIKEDQLSGGRSMKRTSYSITQTCRKTNTDRPLINCQVILGFPYLPIQKTSSTLNNKRRLSDKARTLHFLFEHTYILTRFPNSL